MEYRVTVFTAYFLLFSVLISVSHQSCPKGYYGSPCTPCPVSTYKDFSGYTASCKPCPTNSGHSLRGSISVQDCKCFKGYEGTPEYGVPCQIRHCERLPPPHNGAFVSACNTEYLSVCRMQCLEGYEATSNVERTCDVNYSDIMAWSGASFDCRVIICPPVLVPNANPHSGVCDTFDLTYKTRCIYTCRNGYRLRGDTEHVCQLDKTWSGTPTTCEEITCPKLAPVQAGISVYPSECANGPMRFYSTCHFTCPRGFAVQGGPTSEVQRTLICEVTGKWSGNVPTCYDYEPPLFVKCPGEYGRVQVDNDKGKATAKVFWTVQVTDNSVRVDPSAVIQLHSNHESGKEFPIGLTDIKIKATDQAGNTAACYFRVEVRDIEAPSCSSCPSDIILEATTSAVQVSWDRPVCTDNSGIPPSIDSNRQSGAMFSVPGQYMVEYTVKDDTGNVNRNCTFKITLKVKSCPKLPPPRNGAITCTTGDSPMCVPFCKSGTDFEFNPAMMYFCNAGKWSLFSFIGVTNTNIPNCSASANPSWFKMSGFHFYYYNGGDANDHVVQTTIKSQFMALMNSGMVPPFCQTNPNCKEAYLSVTPGVIG